MSFSVVLITACFTKYLHSILEEREGGTIPGLQWEAKAEPEQTGEIVGTCLFRVLGAFSISSNVPICSSFSYESSTLPTGVEQAAQGGDGVTIPGGA